MTSIDLPERPRILVVTLRRLGDVLLTTPLVRTIRRGFPQGRLDILLFRGSERILKGIRMSIMSSRSRSGPRPGKRSRWFVNCGGATISR